MKKWNDIFDETPAGFHMSVEQTLGELEEKEMKKSIRRMPIVVCAVLIVMAAATAFAATQYFGGVVDWNGNFTELTEDDVVMPTPAPDEPQTDRADYNKYIENVPEGEYWEVWDGTGSGSGAYGPIGYQPANSEELESAIEGTMLNVVNIPGAFNISFLEISYDTFDLEKECYETEQLADGGMFYKYYVDEPTKEDIDGYEIDISDENGNEIYISASLYIADDYEEGLIGNFMVDDGEEYEVLENEKFDRGIVITRTDGARTVRLQKDREGGVIESYYIYVKGEIDIDSVIEMLFD